VRSLTIALVHRASLFISYVIPNLVSEGAPLQGAPIRALILRVNGKTSARVEVRDLVLRRQESTRYLIPILALNCPFTPKAGANGGPDSKRALIDGIRDDGALKFITLTCNIY